MACKQIWKKTDGHICSSLKTILLVLNFTALWRLNLSGSKKSQLWKIKGKWQFNFKQSLKKHYFTVTAYMKPLILELSRMEYSEDFMELHGVLWRYLKMYHWEKGENRGMSAFPETQSPRDDSRLRHVVHSVEKVHGIKITPPVSVRILKNKIYKFSYFCIKCYLNLFLSIMLK